MTVLAAWGLFGLGWLIGCRAGWLLRGVRQRQQVREAAEVLVSWGDRCRVATLISERSIEITPEEIETIGEAFERVLP